MKPVLNNSIVTRIFFTEVFFMKRKSISSNLMTKVTLARNKNMFDSYSYSKSVRLAIFKGIRWAIFSEIRYISITVIATIETVTTTIFLGLSLFFLPFTKAPTKNLFERFTSSSFTIGWASYYAIINLFSEELIADEKSAIEAVSKPYCDVDEKLLWYPQLDFGDLKNLDKKYKKGILKDAKDLPDELKREIFLFLKPIEIINNVRLINKHFKEVVEHSNMTEDLIRRDFVKKERIKGDIKKIKIPDIMQKKFKVEKEYDFKCYKEETFKRYKEKIFKRYKKEIFKIYFKITYLLKEAKTTLTFWGERKIIFSDGSSENLKRFLRKFIKCEQMPEKNWDRCCDLYITSEKLLEKASIIQKVGNFFREIFSDSAEIYKIGKILRRDLYYY